MENRLVDRPSVIGAQYDRDRIATLPGRIASKLDMGFAPSVLSRKRDAGKTFFGQYLVAARSRPLPEADARCVAVCNGHPVESPSAHVAFEIAY